MDSSFPISEWLPNESLFSLCSRAHRVICNASDAETCKRWFGDYRQGIQHDFPCNLTNFADRTNSVLGTSIQIAERRTILPFFAPFQSIERINLARDTMLGSGLGLLKYNLGLITGRFGAAHPLKACPVCIAGEIETLGFSYWHLEHQYPGVITCNRHRTQLHESKLKRFWSGRFSWCLPKPDELLEPEFDLGSSLQPAMQMARSCSKLAALGFERSLDPQLLRRVYVRAIVGEEQTYKICARPSSEAVDSFISFSDRLRRFAPFTAMPASKKDAITYLEHLLRNPRAHGHPLRHLTAIVWLFESFENFLKAYELILSKTFIGAEEPVLSETFVNLPSKKIIVQRIKGSARPKTLKPPLRDKALRLLAKGTDKTVVCRMANITTSTINKLLRSEPDIKEAWEAARIIQESARRRAKWLSCSTAQPDSSTKDVRQSCPETYAWLYRNDRDWLAAQVKGLPNGRKGNNSRVDWLSRDRELSRQLIIKVTLLIKSSESKLSRKEIFQVVPNLPSALRTRDKYPTTVDLFHQILDGNIRNVHL